MKRLCLILIVTLLMALPLQVYADEAAVYNFASAQGDKNLGIPSGRVGQGNIYFYNIDGNRITHITLIVSQAPEGWDVTIEPPPGETHLSISGIPVTITENLYVEPSELLDEEPSAVPDGLVSIKVPGRGYTLGKEARIIITVPDSAIPGATGDITIAAEASWLGQSGAAAVKQARDFDFYVSVTSGTTEYSEEIVDTEEISSPSASYAETTGETNRDTVSQAYADTTSDGNASSPGSSKYNWLLFTLIGVAVILGATLTFVLIRRRR